MTVPKRRWLLKINRHMLKMMLAATALQAVLGFVLGWGFAAFVVAAALVGYQVGTSVGFKHGLDHSYAQQLRGILANIANVEDFLSGELAPDSEERKTLAEARAHVIEELRRVA